MGVQAWKMVVQDCKAAVSQSSDTTFEYPQQTF